MQSTPTSFKAEPQATAVHTKVSNSIQMIKQSNVTAIHSDREKRNSRSIMALLCVLWALSILVTSSTVITPEVFFDWFREHVFNNEGAFERFKIFWGVSWLFIVKGWHVTEFAILTALATWAIDRYRGQRSRANIIWAGVLCFAYAISDEWHQSFVPQRNGVWTDVVIDTAGILISGAILSRGRLLRSPRWRAIRCWIFLLLTPIAYWLLRDAAGQIWNMEYVRFSLYVEIAMPGAWLGVLAIRNSRAFLCSLPYSAPYASKLNSNCRCELESCRDHARFLPINSSVIFA